jgi:hypothetical protein
MPNKVARKKALNVRKTVVAKSENMEPPNNPSIKVWTVAKGVGSKTGFTNPDTAINHHSPKNNRTPVKGKQRFRIKSEFEGEFEFLFLIENGKFIFAFPDEKYLNNND